jgi:phosphatidate cytidylyltransferase
MEPQNDTTRFALKTRVISGVVIAIFVLLALWIGGIVFIALVMLAGLQMIREWDNLTVNENILWRLAGLLYVGVPCMCLMWLRGVEGGGLLVLMLILVVSSTDIGAFFVGRYVGGLKLAPTISPNKTWAGFFGGVAMAALIAVISKSFSSFPSSISSALWLGLFLGALSQGGDLFESWLKRRAGVKDSGNLIPGHGGLLDRVDSLVFTAPLFALLVWLA